MPRSKNSQFEWQVGGEGADQEIIARIERPSPGGWLNRLLTSLPPGVRWLLLGLLVVLGVTVYWLVRYRYEQALERLKFQIQAVVDLEAQAFAEGNWSRFLAQQDESDIEWYWRQDQRTRAHCPPVSDLFRSPDGCWSVLPARVQQVDLRGQIAWVEVIEGQPAARRARFYRQTPLGWKRTSPQAGLWGDVVETQFEKLSVRCYRRDLPHLQFYLRPISEAVNRACDTVGCPTDGRVQVEFVVRSAPDLVPRWQNERILVDSPWLLGVPADATDSVSAMVSPAYVEPMRQLAVAAAVQLALRVPAGQSPTAWQTAIAQEYLAWRERPVPAQAPLLGRILERRGDAVLPQVFESAAAAPSLGWFLERWFGVRTDRPDAAFFQLLLDVEREALLAGRRETFLLLQGVSSDPGGSWDQAQVIDLYRRITSSATLARLAPLQVEAVQVGDNLAQVTLQRPLSDARSNALPLTEFFVRQNGDWKHLIPYYILDAERAVSSGVASSPGIVDLTFACAGSEQAMLVMWAEAFRHQNPHIRVTVVSLEELVAWGGLPEQTAYRILSQADAALWPTMPDMIPLEWTYDLSGWVVGDPDFAPDDFYPGVLNPGVHYVPAQINMAMLLFDRDAFDVAGLPYPRPGWTQDEFSAAAQALTIRQGNSVERYGFVDMVGVGPALIASRAGSLWDESVWPPRPAFDSPSVVEATRWYVGLSLDERVMPHNFVPMSTRWQLIDQKRAAMWSDSLVNWPLRSAQMRLGVATLPAGRAAGHPWWATGYVISSGTLNPEETWQWVRFLSYQWNKRSDRLSFSPRRPVAEQQSDWALWDAQTGEAIRYALEHLWPPQDAAAMALFGQAVNRALDGRNVQAMLEEAQSAAQGAAMP